MSAVVPGSGGGAAARARLPRRPAAGEAAEVAAVWLRARRAAVPAIPAPVHTDADTRAYLSGIVVDGGDVWVLGDAGGPVRAMMVLAAGWIEHLYVDPAHQGRGLGSVLVRHAQAAGAPLELWTFASNAGARRFYERHGFEAVATSEGDNEEGAPDVRYRWSP